MDCNVNGLRNKIGSLDQAVGVIKNALAQGEWDDDVKASYQQYDADCGSISSSIKQAINSLSSVVEEISAIDTAATSSEISNLNREVQGIKVGE